MPTTSNAISQQSASSSISSSSVTLRASETTQSDNMHHTSPFPVPPEERRAEMTHAGSSSKRAASPEPLTANDVMSMRRRVQEICSQDAGRQNGSGRNINSAPHLSPRERELVDMVLRLTDPLPIDPVQLARQADTISSLTTQRDYIMREIEEERERWCVERDVWERTAEALLSQRVKPQKSEDAGRQREIYESDLRVLRLKLHETQRRLSQYESELQRLKPLLLMQQFPKSRNESRHDKGKESEANPHYPNSQSQTQHQDKGKRREGDPQQINNTSGSHESAPENRESNTATPFIYTPPAFVTKNKPPQPAEASQRQPRSSRERPPGASKSSKRRHTPLTSDAYVEHFLLAAKRIGRVRATHVSGVLQHAEHEKEILTSEQQRAHDVKEQERLERERLDRLATGTSGLAYYRSTAEGVPQRVPAAPHTPKKQIHYGPSAGTTPIVFVHTLSPPTPLAGPSNATTTSFAAAGYVGSPLATSSHTAAQSGAATGRGSQATSNPPTPLDSLLDAARMMDDGPITKRRRADGRGREPEEPESPVPKRRRVSAERAGNQSPALNGSGDVDGRERSIGATAMQRRGAGPDRVRSALDVLADQAAAAFNEPEQSDRRASLAAAAVATKGKGRTRNGAPHDAQHEDHHPSTSTFIQVDPSSSTSGGPTTVPARGRPRARGGSAGSKRAPANTNVTLVRPSLPPPSSSSTLSDTAAIPTQPTMSASGRPQRNAAKRHAAVSPDAPRGGSRTRGRPRGGAPKRGVAAPEPRVISPARARVIAPAPRHTPRSDPTPGADAQHVDAAMASGSAADAASVHILLPPAMAAANEGAAPAQAVLHITEEDRQSGSVASMPAAKVEANGLGHTLPVVSGPSSDLDVEMAAPGANEEGETDADADAEEDLDADGEQEDDAESEPKDAPRRSKSPPPPPPGANSGPPHGNDDNGSDADEDAEGEMEFEDGDDASAGGSRASGTQQLMQDAMAVCASYLTLQSPALVRYPIVSQALRVSTTSDCVTVLSPTESHIAHDGKTFAKPNLFGVESERSQVILPKSHPRERLVKWGNINHQLASTGATTQCDIRNKPPSVLKQKMDSSSVQPSARTLIYYTTRCEPPFRTLVPLNLPIVEVA